MIVFLGASLARLGSEEGFGSFYAFGSMGTENIFSEERNLM